MTDSAGWKIVLIDDEDDIREVTGIALRDAGYEVVAAPDGETGIGLCRKISPRIVITDIRMPGMDGLRVLEVLKNESPDIEVIVATAFGEMNLAVRALQLDASDFITKPIDMEALHLALNRAKNRYTTRKSLADYTALLEKEKAETSQELLRNIKFQRNLIESSMDGILGCDENGTVIIFNRSLERMLGYSAGEAVRKTSMSRFLLPGDAKRLESELKSEKHGGKDRLFMHETMLVGKDGRRIPVQVSASVMYDLEKETGTVCFFRDLREIRKLEREVADQARILHQDKMVSLGRLAASVVHEINNPLSGILNYMKLMSRIIQRGPLKDEHMEKFRRYLDLAENETGRCSNIVSSLLTFSRKTEPAFESVDVEELVSRCVVLSGHKLDLSNITLEHVAEPGMPPAHGDFNQLQQCVINLVFNAIDAMPDGGTLKIGARFDDANESVEVVVSDSGPGIDPENTGRVFEPFFTTKNEGYGVGLGLSTVYGIMERHNGTVTLKSSPGKGAAFFLRIPAAKNGYR